jgi:hypothetical protein
MKYRLIKNYPSLSEWIKLGSIVTKSTLNPFYYYFINNNIQFPAHEIENYPEYWKKVVDRDYEILEIHYKSNIENVIIEYSKGVAIKRNDDIYIVNTCSLKEFTEKDWKNYINITKIKRLSDNEIFCIGDKVANPAGITFTISKFYLDSKSEKMLANGDYDNGISINKISHVKFLLTTEDGVKVFKGDTCYCVIKEIMKVLKWSNIVDDGTLDKYVYFSTKQAAEQYIALHKKQYSLNDFIQLMNRLKDEKS